MSQIRDNQCEKVIRHLRRFGSITPWQAIKRYGITRLGARIWDLKKTYDIDSRLVSHRGKRFARYSLA